MLLAEFLNTVRRQTHHKPAGIPDPLTAVVSLIEGTPAAPRAAVLRRVLGGLRDRDANFEESESFALDATAIAIVDALTSDYLGGRYSDADLASALSMISTTR